jgi:hypothetical protein
MSHLREEGDAFSRSIANALEAFRKGVDGELRKSMLMPEYNLKCMLICY